MKNELQNKYALAAQKLGDVEYRISQLKKVSEDLKKEMLSLNMEFDKKVTEKQKDGGDKNVSTKDGE